MGKFNRNSRDRGPRKFGKKNFGGRGFDGGRKFGGGDSGRPIMHQATCDKCGKDCEVPFRPTGSRPVFCSDCFANQGDRPRFRDSSDRRPKFGGKKMFEAVCGKCGSRCEVPFRPTEGKPVFCSQCFDKGGGAAGGRSADQLKAQFAILNSKLDRVLKILDIDTIVKADEPSKVAKEKKEPEKDKKASVKKKTTAKKATKKKK